VSKLWPNFHFSVHFFTFVRVTILGQFNWLQLSFQYLVFCNLIYESRSLNSSLQKICYFWISINNTVTWRSFHENTLMKDLGLGMQLSENKIKSPYLFSGTVSHSNYFADDPYTAFGFLHQSIWSALTQSSHSSWSFW